MPGGPVTACIVTLHHMKTVSVIILHISVSNFMNKKRQKQLY